MSVFEVACRGNTIKVSAAQVAAAKVMVKRHAARGEHPTDALFAIANATKAPAPKKVSTNMIRTTHVREIDINRITTVSDLFALIDLPYRITKKATVSIEAGTATLRLEWRGEPE
jgi:hypothetical protein